MAREPVKHRGGQGFQVTGEPPGGKPDVTAVRGLPQGHVITGFVRSSFFK